MRQTVKILKIKDLVIAANGLKILAILYKTKYDYLLEQAKDNSDTFILDRHGELSWHTDDIINIKECLGNSLELEIVDVVEKV